MCMYVCTCMYVYVSVLFISPLVQFFSLTLFLLQILDGLIVYSINNTSPSPHTPTTLSPLTTLTLHTTVNDGLWHTITMTTETGVTQVYTYTAHIHIIIKVKIGFFKCM